MPGTEKGRSAQVWSEEELIDGQRTLCLTVILHTIGCSWWRSSGGCTMCGYNAAVSDASITQDSILRQFDSAWNSISGHSLVKIYTSGSFLDDNELATATRDAILKRAGEAGVRLLFESRPEYVNRELIDHCLSICPNIEIALGLESANEEVLSKSIHKGFHVADYRRAAEIARDAGTSVRTYLLLKPPYLTEGEAVRDAIDGVREASGFSRVISLNPVNVQRGTLVDKMHWEWAYRPPWLWSILKVLKEAEADGSVLISSLVGAGSVRGPHNCGDCDADVIVAIDGFNLTQNRSKLEIDDCDCIQHWRRMLSTEQFALAPGEHERFFTRDVR